VSPENYETEADNIDFFCLPAKQKLSELICQSKKIVCRSGYSTLMDLHLLEKKQLLLIPTPGQPEQEYLAEYWNARFGCELMPQSSYEKITF
jgi:predicted glycosyltransferase